MIMYSVDAETFYDDNGDGIGDFIGLRKRLDYLAGMGINCIWVLPFFPSPNRDNGYDVMDYYNIDPRLGTLGEFVEFIDHASDLGIRVIIDLVINHTSVKHPWFQEARKDPNSKYRNYYVWSDEPQDFENEEMPLAGEENTLWTYDKSAKQYYLHRFYKEQPDLNMGNSEVRKEILRIMGFWLKMGVSGFRVDAAQMLVEPYGLNNVSEKDLIDFLEEMRDFISLKKGDAILLGETNIKFDEMETYLKNGSKLHMLFDFHLNQQLFLAMARQSAAPLYKTIKKLPKLHPTNELLNFLRTHDELSLKLLTEKEKEDVLKAFAPDENMRVFDRGIRRRIAPMFDNNEQQMKLSFSLLFSLPGVPMIRYGDEIGMGDDLSLKGRNSVRTPMQWSESKNGGFSLHDDKLPHPAISKGEYAFSKVNVAQEHIESDSFLNWVERIISARKQCSLIGHGGVELIESQHKSVFIHGYNHSNERILFIHNLSADEAIIGTHCLSFFESDYYRFFGSLDVKIEAEEIKIHPYGFIWLKELQN